jgi:hypothetical protein
MEKLSPNGLNFPDLQNDAPKPVVLLPAIDFDQFWQADMAAVWEGQ